MSDNTPSDTNNDEAKRTNLAPILAPIITLFIGFGAGVVFHDFIPLGKATTFQPTPSATPSTGPRDEGRSRSAEQPEMDPETRQALEEAAAEGDEAAQQMLDEQQTQDDSDTEG